jgi:hypothetical protein
MLLVAPRPIGRKEEIFIGIILWRRFSVRHFVRQLG